jgi:hypothetical protein
VRRRRVRLPDERRLRRQRTLLCRPLRSHGPRCPGQCAACDDGGCDPATAQTCTDRECRCGDNAGVRPGHGLRPAQRAGGLPVPRLPHERTMRRERTLLRRGLHVAPDPDFQCEACGHRLRSRNRADTCRSVPAADGHDSNAPAARGDALRPAGPSCRGASADLRGVPVRTRTAAIRPAVSAWTTSAAPVIPRPGRVRRQRPVLRFSVPAHGSQCRTSSVRPAGQACDVETTDSCTA